VQCLRGKLEASQRSEEELTHQESWAQSQIEVLMSQMASLKDTIASQEA
jgi:hypothetical protein